MDTLSVVVIVVLALAAGVALGVVIGSARARATAATADNAVAAELGSSRAEATALAQQLERERNLHRELAEQARQEDLRRDERERGDHSVLRALAPVQETLQAMQAKVDDLERDRQRQYGSLAEQLRQAQDAGEALRSTTESLAGALRSTSVRGVWGEAQLRRIVEAAGLTRHVDFDLQSSTESDSGRGRPDLVVRLPGGKSLAVDAKAPMAAYLEAAEIPLTAQGADADRRAKLLAQHVKALRAHVDALAKKEYWAGLTSSPEFVVCFVPSESLLAAALEEDPALLDYAFQRRVAVASPVNLWAVLKTVAYTWTQQNVADEARTLFRLGNELYQRLGGLAGHAHDLRRAIVRTVESYNAFTGSLEKRVLVSARRFPGIDETRLDAVSAPAPIEDVPRILTAEEFASVDDDGDVSPRTGSYTETAPLYPADIGELRHRLEDDEKEISRRGTE